ncbi:MarR family winged helix-turn-helix transcriptional regulator [Caenibius tardaugens]|nr:MarR family winged helix-turn-helix transcriptional regulator [Caenibius tardaugens]
MHEPASLMAGGVLVEEGADDVSSAMERVANAIVALRRNPHNRAIQRYIYLVGDHELTPVQVDILETVVNNPGQRMNELADALGVDASTVSRTTLPLVKLGLIKRQSDASDRRLTMMVPTEKGRKQARTIMESRRTMMYRVQSHLPQDRLDAFGELLEAYIGAVNVEGTRILKELRGRR